MLTDQMQLTMFLQFTLALLLGGILGYEREVAYKSAGIRTFAVVCAGSCLFGIVSIYLLPSYAHNIVLNPERIAAQVASGVGFLGAGIMFREGPTTQGLTTAASLWASAAIGLAVSFSLYILAVTSTLLIFSLFLFSQSKFWTKLSPKHKRTKND